MASGGDILNMLLPNGRFVVVGNTYEGITWFDDNQITKEEFEAGFEAYEAWKAEQDAAKAAKKASAEAKLVALGLDLDDLRALGL
jgi:hypothetical protein